VLFTLDAYKASSSSAACRDKPPNTSRATPKDSADSIFISSSNIFRVSSETPTGKISFSTLDTALYSARRSSKL